ncbi:MAG: hypothetical protein WCK18_13140 [Prolixibacteraceae bacterium]
MKSILLFLLLSSLSLFSFAQVAANKTDSRGMKQGKWIGKYPDGTLKYEGKFFNDKPIGEWKRYHENGKLKAQMSYYPNSERAFASLFDTDAKLYAKGVFENTLRDSIWNFFSAEKVVLTESYHLGKKEGTSKAFDQKSQLISEKEWKNDMLDGKSTEFYPNGQKRSEITFSGGAKNGLALFYDQDGAKTVEGNYKEDLSEGEWKFFEKEGKVKYKIQYDKGNILNSAALDSLQLNEFKKFDKLKGKIPEPAVNETGRP